MDISASMLRLSNEILLHIFSYCDSKTLCILSRVCKLWYQLISYEDSVWRRNGHRCPVTNQLTQEIKARSCYLLKSKEKCRVSLNWTKHQCRKVALIKHHKNYMPWLQLCSDTLWISQGKHICGYAHLTSGIIRTKNRTVLSSAEDTCRFVLRDNTIVSGGSVGGINAWSVDTGNLKFGNNACHREEINSVDYYPGMVVSGSRDKSVKVWSCAEPQLTERHSISLTDRVWSVAIGPAGDTFASGTSGNREDPLCVFDSKTGSTLSRLKDDFIPGSGIFHIVYETPHCMLTCGFDTTIRLWDTRTMRRVTKWINPYDMAVICLSSDQNFSFVSGSGTNSAVCLWDKRKLNHIQTFYADRGLSPVYSVVFDPCHLYVSLDRSLTLLDFNGMLTGKKWAGEAVRSPHQFGRLSTATSSDLFMTVRKAHRRRQ